MRQLRWRLARWIAPVPVLQDPGEGKVFILVREETTDDFCAWFKADKFRLKMTSRMPRLSDDRWALVMDEPTTVGRFAGTISV